MLNNNFKGEVLKEVGKANKSLVLWMQAAREPTEVDVAHRYLLSHYTFFVQLRAQMVKDGLDPAIAEEATKIAGGPFAITG